MGQTKTFARRLLESIWTAQIAYNAQIRTHEQPDDYEYWMKQYLLGAVSEVDEILNEINWKAHRRGKTMIRENLARELADLTKYVLSLWEWSGFSLDQMLAYIWGKTQELDIQYRQEFLYSVPPEAPVVITDIDGTLGDYRGAFYTWLQMNKGVKLPPDNSRYLAMEIDLGLPYSEYLRYKEEFEATGGYQQLNVYHDAFITIRTLKAMGVQILAYTARPAQQYSRIWADTWEWLRTIELDDCIQELRIGGEQRIARACDLKEKGHKVAMLEDDPTLAIRAANAGIQVVMRAQPYNVGVDHDNIHRREYFGLEDLTFFWLEIMPND